MVYLLLFIWFSLGFVCGYIANKNRVEDAIKVADKLLAERNTVSPGIIRRPSAQKLYEKQLPPKEREGLQAMRESLQQVPELNDTGKFRPQ